MHLKLAQSPQSKHDLYLYLSGLLYYWSQCNSQCILLVCKSEMLLENIPT